MWRRTRRHTPAAQPPAAASHRVPWEERPAVDHLRKDAPDRPDVHGRGVGLCPQQDFGRAVPERDDLRAEGWMMLDDVRGTSMVAMSYHAALLGGIHFQRLLWLTASLDVPAAAWRDTRLPLAIGHASLRLPVHVSACTARVHTHTHMRAHTKTPNTQGQARARTMHTCLHAQPSQTNALKEPLRSPHVCTRGRGCQTLLPAQSRPA